MNTTQLEFPFPKPKPRYVPHEEGKRRLRAIREALENAVFTKNQDAPKKD